jgi:hypothetical protein
MKLAAAASKRTRTLAYTAKSVGRLEPRKIDESAAGEEGVVFDNTQCGKVEAGCNDRQHPTLPMCRFISAIRKAPGNAVQTKTPSCSYGNTSHEAPICPALPKSSSTRSRCS